MAYTQQPMANPGMSVNGGNLNAKNLPMGENGREYSHGFFDCFEDAGTCILAWLVPCVVYGQVSNRYDHLESKGVPDPDHGGLCNSACMLHCCLTSCCAAGCIMQTMKRGSIRNRYKIEGNGCTDCLAASFCTPCQLTQDSRELELEEYSFSGK